MIDTHVHYGTAAYAEDLQIVKESDRAAGVCQVLCLPISFEDNYSQFDNTACYADSMKYAVGIHPKHVPVYPPQTFAKGGIDRELDLCRERIRILEEFRGMIHSLQEIINERKDQVTAVGETGIDTSRDAGRQNLFMQKISLREHLLLSQKNHLPLVLHLRGEDAFREALSVMKQGRLSRIHYRGVVHCFHGTVEDMAMMLDQGNNDFVFGIGGVLTYPERGAVLRETLRTCPEEMDILSRIVLETDSPYLVPVKMLEKGVTRNIAGFLVEVVSLLAEILHTAPEEIIRRTTDNARRMGLV